MAGPSPRRPRAMLAAPAVLSALWLSATLGATPARADGHKVRDRVRMGPTTVTVIDEGESINDVISRVRERRAQAREQRQDQRDQRQDQRRDQRQDQRQEQTSDEQTARRNAARKNHSPGEFSNGKRGSGASAKTVDGATPRPGLREVLHDSREKTDQGSARLNASERQESRREARAEARRERLQKMRQRREDGDHTTRARRPAP